MAAENEGLRNATNLAFETQKKLNQSGSICIVGLSVAWKNLSVSVKQNQPAFFKKRGHRYTGKNILRDVSGGVKPKTLVAILGASGSGKSTLMSILANRQPDGLRVSGKVSIGGTPIGKFTRYVSGFVYQDDLFVTLLTVKEHMNFMAKLRLDRNMTEMTRKTLINEVLNELGLTEVANRRIGNSKFGAQKVSLSGGERKRLSIASELITDPSLLFCDEPTTGLDSYTAFTVVTNLRKLVDQRHKTIICSIHQPNEQIFEQFDQIILLNGGKIAFSGSKSEAISFFKSTGYTPNVDQNPADFLIQSLAVESKTKKIDKFCTLYENSDYYAKTMEFVDNEMKMNVSQNELLSKYSNRVNEPPWLTKFYHLTHRGWLCLSRDNRAQRFRLMQRVIMGLIIALCLHDTITWTQRGLQALKGAIFFLITQNFFPPMHAASAHIPAYLPMFFREYANNTTTPLLFISSTVISLLPGFIIDPILFTIVIYFITNVPGNVGIFLLTCLITTLVFNISAALGMLISVAFKKKQMFDIVTTPIVLVCIVCSGVYIKLSTIPLALRWIRFVSWFTSGVETLFIVYVQGVRHIECNPNPNSPCLKTGSEVLDSFDFHAENLWTDILKMFLTFLFLHSLSYLVLLNKVRSKERAK